MSDIGQEKGSNFFPGICDADKDKNKGVFVLSLQTCKKVEREDKEREGGREREERGGERERMYLLWKTYPSKRHCCV